MHMLRLKWGMIAVLMGLCLALPMFARDTRLLIRVRPSQAYVFVDGAGKGDASFSGNRRLLLAHVAPVFPNPPLKCEAWERNTTWLKLRSRS